MTETAAVKRAKAKVSKAEPTEYVVLSLTRLVPTTNIGEVYDFDTLDALGKAPVDLQEGVWIEVDRITTHGQEKPVIEKWANAKRVGGTFKLVPARSWKGGVRVFEQTRMASEPIA